MGALFKQTMIQERIQKRAKLIAKLEQLQKIDMGLIGKIEPVPLTKEVILKKVLKCHRTDFESVFRKHKASGKINRDSRNVKIRQMYFFMCKKFTNFTLKDIGVIEHNRKVYKVFDHATVIHGIQAHEDLIDCYKSHKKFSDSVIKNLSI